ncbi:thioredoxin family protein [Marisediminicola sp. LYQ134]|uniref:thioredoxin family protein n=1 Tax=unclassified Marisediminicola TaxID=2618316 RepID=UPI003983465E
MDPFTSAVVVLAVVALAVVIGVVSRARSGRAHAVSARPTGAKTGGFAELGLSADDPRGSTATLVLYSTEFCAQCPAARRVLADIASSRESVSTVDVDLTHRPDLARRLRILQTPTVFIVDSAGVPISRMGGALRRDAVTSELDRWETSDVVQS